MIPKFRAWDKNKKIFTNYQIVDDMLYFMDKFIAVWIRDDNQDRFVLMQSTGLFDKYGVEIYEGDIIDVGTRIPFLNEIKKDEETAYLKLVPLDKRWTESYFTNFKDKSRYEVIGNIYENPELLEVLK